MKEFNYDNRNDSEARESVMVEAETYWTEEEHRDQVIEECGELIVAMHHLKRNKCTELDVVKEMIDIEIMLDRFRKFFEEKGIDWDEVKGWKLLEMKETMDEGKK